DPARRRGKSKHTDHRERDGEQETRVSSGGEGHRDAKPDLVDAPDDFPDAPAEGGSGEERPCKSGAAGVAGGGQRAAEGRDERGRGLSDVVDVDRGLVADPVVGGPAGEKDRDYAAGGRGDGERAPSVDAQPGDDNRPAQLKGGGRILHGSSVGGGAHFRTGIPKSRTRPLSQANFHLTSRGSYL